MEALAISTPVPSHAKALLSAELRVPSHDPGVIESQPRSNRMTDAIGYSDGAIVKSPSHQTTSADSGYNSLHIHDSPQASSHTGPLSLTQPSPPKQQQTVLTDKPSETNESQSVIQKRAGRITTVVPVEAKHNVIVEALDHNRSGSQLCGQKTKNWGISRPEAGTGRTPSMLAQRPLSSAVPQHDSLTAQSSSSVQHSQHGRQLLENGITNAPGDISGVTATRTEARLHKLLFWKHFQTPRSKNSPDEKQKMSTQKTTPAIAQPEQNTTERSNVSDRRTREDDRIVSVNKPLTAKLVENPTISLSPLSDQLPQPVGAAESIGTSNLDNMAPLQHKDPEKGRNWAFVQSTRRQSAVRIAEKTRLNPTPHTSIALVTSLYVVDEGLYMGGLRDFPPPPEIEFTWSTTIRSRLITDLRPVLASLPSSLARDATTVELELCMSGRNTAGSTTVHLKPTIWVRCGSKQAKKAVRAALADLSYLHAFPLHITLEAPRFASNAFRISVSTVHQDSQFQKRDDAPSSSTAIIIGAVVGGIGGLVLLLVLIYYFFKRRRRMSHITGNGAADFPSFDFREEKLNSSPAYAPPRKQPPPLSSVSTSVFKGKEAYSSEKTENRNNGPQLADNIKSICGARIDFDAITFDLTCTIGGIVKVGNNLYGLTTAHGIWDQVLQHHNQQHFDDVCDVIGTGKQHVISFMLRLIQSVKTYHSNDCPDKVGYGHQHRSRGMAIPRSAAQTWPKQWMVQTLLC